MFYRMLIVVLVIVGVVMVFGSDRFGAPTLGKDAMSGVNESAAPAAKKQVKSDARIIEPPAVVRDPNPTLRIEVARAILDKYEIALAVFPAMAADDLWVMRGRLVLEDNIKTAYLGITAGRAEEDFMVAVIAAPPGIIPVEGQMSRDDFKAKGCSVLASCNIKYRE